MQHQYFVYMLQSSSRRALYTGVTNALVTRVVEHRSGKNRKSFAARYRAFRLVYYEEYSDIRSAIAREKQIKGWTRAKKDALVRAMNPQWRDLLAEWENKYGIRFLPGDVVLAESQPQPQQQPQGPSRNTSTQDDKL